MIDQKTIDRINELAKKQRESGLSDGEKAEQAELRRAYINAYKENLEAQLDHMVILRPDGTKEAVKKRKNPGKEDK